MLVGMDCVLGLWVPKFCGFLGFGILGYYFVADCMFGFGCLLWLSY